MNNTQGDERKLRHKSFLMRSQERNDYKLEPSKALDIVAAIVSFVAAVFVWLYI